MTMPELGEIVFTMRGELKAISKQRPRTGKAGHFFTPKRTRDYERAVREMAEVFVTGPPVDFPIALEVNIQHRIPKSWALWKANVALMGLIFPSLGDLDNKVKAISDALNGIVFVDDVQVCRLTAEMQYGSSELITVTASRAGYTLAEARQYYEEASEGGVGMGG